uniref:Portal protein n=1 Tax=viral metagenome TaxID=1070528 RepID=A0A6M3L642_9ZZZZ
MGFLDRFKKTKPEVIKYADGVEVREKPNVREYGVQGNLTTNWNKFFGLGDVLNPDEIGIQTYKEMMKDAEVRVGFNFIRNSILSRKWKLSYPEKTNNKEAGKILEFIRFSFGDIDENAQFEKSLGKLLYAIPYGFSVIEIVWKIIKGGKFSGKVGIKKLKDLDPEHIFFETNKYGDIEKIIQKTGDDKDITIPLEKAIVYTLDKEFGNHYGTSRLRSVHKNWFVKKVVIKFWNIALERFGMPILVGTVPSKNDLDKMLTLLDNVQTRSSIAKTEGWEIEALETGIGKSAGGDYKDALEYHNSQILRGMLVPPLLISGKGGGGSYALSNTQFGLFQTMLKGLEIDISNIVEEKIIKPLVIFNYGTQDVYPQFVFEPMTKEDLLNLSKVFALLVKNGVVGNDEQWMRDMMGVPHRDVAEVTRDTIKDKTKDKGEGATKPIPAQRIEQTRIDKTKGTQQVKTGKTPTTGGKRSGVAGGDKTPV